MAERFGPGGLQLGTEGPGVAGVLWGSDFGGPSLPEQGEPQEFAGGERKRHSVSVRYISCLDALI